MTERLILTNLNKKIITIYINIVSWQQKNLLYNKKYIVHIFIMNFFKKVLIILILINIFYLSFLISSKNKFFIKNPKFGVIINQIINDEHFCQKFNSNIDNIFNISGKGIIFNIYDIEDNTHKYNIDLINRVLEEKLNVNIIDIIYYEKNLDKDLVNDFILRHNINRPVFYVDRSFLYDKLSIDSNSIIISDFNINNVVRLDKIDYNLLEDNLYNLYKKTKKVKIHPISTSTKVQNDELLIKSIHNPVIVRNNEKNGEKELFFNDKIGKKIFGIHLDGSLNYYIGNGKDNDGLIENIRFNDINSIKEYNNELYVLDSFSLKKINFDTKKVDIILQDKALNNINDFCILNENQFIFTEKTGKLVLYGNDKFKKVKNNVDIITKIEKYDNKVFLLDTNNSKIYFYSKNEIKEYFNLNGLNIIDFTIYNDIFYLLDNDSKIHILSDNTIMSTKQFDILNNIKNIAIDDKNLYLSDNVNLYKIVLKDLNNENYEKKIQKIDFKFSYKSKNYFKNIEYDFYNYKKITVWKNNTLLININNNDKVDIEWNAPNYINLYEINDNKLINKQETNIINNNIIFDNIDTNKGYYLNGKIYYKYKNNIFIKKINDFVNFKNNHSNKSIEINFNTIYT